LNRESCAMATNPFLAAAPQAQGGNPQLRHDPRRDMMGMTQQARNGEHPQGGYPNSRGVDVLRTREAMMAQAMGVAQQTPMAQRPFMMQNNPYQRPQFATMPANPAAGLHAQFIGTGRNQRPPMNMDPQEAHAAAAGQHMAMYNAEALKRPAPSTQCRREKNRISAKKFRTRKKQYMNTLESMNKQLVQEHKALKKELGQTEGLLTSLVSERSALAREHEGLQSLLQKLAMVGSAKGNFSEAIGSVPTATVTPTPTHAAAPTVSANAETPQIATPIGGHISAPITDQAPPQVQQQQQQQQQQQHNSSYSSYRILLIQIPRCTRGITT